MSKKETPYGIKEAVRKYIENRDLDYIADMFLMGYPLHEHPETRDLILKLILQQKLPDRRRITTKEKHEHELRMMYRIAELHYGECKYMLISQGETKGESACSIVSKDYGVKPDALYKKWQKYKATPEVERHIELVKKFSQDFDIY